MWSKYNSYNQLYLQTVEILAAFDGASTVNKCVGYTERRYVDKIMEVLNISGLSIPYLRKKYLEWTRQKTYEIM